MCTPKSDALAQTPAGGDDGAVPSMAATLVSFIFPQRLSCDHHSPRPPVERPPPPPPEAIQVAVMIAMPSPPSLTSRSATDGPDYVGQPSVGEYQIGVVRIPWS